MSTFHFFCIYNYETFSAVSDDDHNRGYENQEYSANVSNPPASSGSSRGYTLLPKPHLEIYDDSESTPDREYSEVRKQADLNEQLLTPTQGQAATRLQAATYGKHLLSSGLLRNHAIGMVMDSLAFRLVYFDHSIIIESEVSFRVVTRDPDD